MIKLILSPRTKRGMSRAQLRQHLEFVHGPLCLAHEEVGGRFSQYIHHYVLDGYEEPLGKNLMPDRDVVTCIWFKDEADFKASLQCAAFHEFIAPDEDNFRELEGSIGFKAREWIVRKPLSPVGLKLFVFRRVKGDADEAAARWAANMAVALGSDPASGIASFTANAVQSAFTDSEFNQIDEVGLHAGVEIHALLDVYDALAQREFGSLSAQMVVTEPKIFKSA